MNCKGCNEPIDGKPWYCRYEHGPYCKGCASECYEEDNSKYIDYEPNIYQGD